MVKLNGKDNTSRDLGACLSFNENYIGGNKQTSLSNNNHVTHEKRLNVSFHGIENILVKYFVESNLFRKPNTPTNQGNLIQALTMKG